VTESNEPRVTQRAREAAAQIMELQERHEMADLIRAGDRDSSNTVQTIVRFEAAHAAIVAELVEALGGLAEALDAITNFTDMSSRYVDADAFIEVSRAANARARAILAKHQQGGEG
jgi:hypothetical protein